MLCRLDFMTQGNWERNIFYCVSVEEMGRVREREREGDRERERGRGINNNLFPCPSSLDPAFLPPSLPPSPLFRSQTDTLRANHDLISSQTASYTDRQHTHTHTHTHTLTHTKTATHGDDAHAPHTPT